MKKAVILLLFVLPYIAFAQKAQKLAELNKLGKAAILKNDSVKSIQYFEEAFKLDSNNKISRLGYALTHKDTTAYKIFNQLLVLAPEDTSLHILRAYCSLTIEKQYRKALNRNLISLWFGRTVNDYQWLQIHNVDPDITHYNMDIAQATWAGNTMWGANNPAAVSQAALKAKEAEANDISKNEYLTLFIGRMFKQTGLDTYLQTCLNYSPVDKKVYQRTKDGDVELTYSFAKNITGKKKKTPLSFIYTLTGKKDGTIKRVSISGNRFDLAELFASYWPVQLSVQQTKDKRVARTRLLSDKIVYTAWNPDYAVIIISPVSTGSTANR
jgi:hypothetical protein